MFEKLKEFCAPLAKAVNLSADVVLYIALGLVALIVVLAIVLIVVGVKKARISPHSCSRCLGSKSARSACP